MLLGHLLTTDSVGAVMGGMTGVLALISGTWFPIGRHACYDIVRFLPSYWLVQASHVALGGAAWGALGWLVVVAWSVGLGALAARAFQRDTKRV